MKKINRQSVNSSLTVEANDKLMFKHRKLCAWFILIFCVPKKITALQQVASTAAKKFYYTRSVQKVSDLFPSRQ